MGAIRADDLVSESPEELREPRFRVCQRVLVEIGREWVRCMVVAVHKTPFSVWLDLRRDGLIGGRRYPLISRNAELVRPLPVYDSTTANVYADFLEEHGHPEAAALLRQAFPLEDGKPREGGK